MPELNLNEIENDAGTQFRQKLDQATIDDYSEAMLAGAIFPPLTVFSPKGSQRYVLADGFHRLEAARECGHQTIAAEIREGGARDAVEYALGANDAHGLRLSNKDKRKKIEAALKDPEWSSWSNREIAKLCRVGDKTVAKVRTESNLLAPDKVKTPKTDKGGNPVTQKAKKDAASSDQVRKYEPATPHENEVSVGEPVEQPATPRISEVSVNGASEISPRISEVKSERTAVIDAIDTIRSLPLDGGEAVEAFDLYDLAADFEYLREWAAQALDEIHADDSDDYIPW
jgi:uncharacterized ParB-like nuclease family protein